MEWVETTGKTIEAARESALDQLGVAADEAEFDVLEEPRTGLFGLIRGEARLRARVRPTQVRPKQDRRRRGRERTDKRDEDQPTGVESTERSPAVAGEGAATAPRSTRSRKATAKQPSTAAADVATTASVEAGTEDASPEERPGPPRRRRTTNRTTDQARDEGEESTVTNDETPAVPPADVGAAAVQFMEGLTTAFGASGTTTLDIDDLDLEVSVDGSELGLLVGPGGRTLNAIQDLARVAAQRRLGDHETRLRIDVAGYRARREAALGAFARDVAEQVRSSGSARALEPMVSADRKVVHDALNDEPGVVSRSVGEDPDRRIVVEPA